MKRSSFSITFSEFHLDWVQDMSIQSSIANMLPISISIFQHASLGVQNSTTAYCIFKSAHMQAFTQMPSVGWWSSGCQFPLVEWLPQDPCGILLDSIREKHRNPKIDGYACSQGSSTCRCISFFVASNLFANFPLASKKGRKRFSPYSDCTLMPPVDIPRPFLKVSTNLWGSWVWGLDHCSSF